MLPTAHLGALPYARRVMAALDSVIGRSRLMRIPEEGDLYEHVDVAYYWRDHLRVHVPVVTDPSVQFTCGGESVHMGVGEVWIFDTWRRHKVINPAKFPRTHLVIDTVGSAGLWNAIHQPDRSPITVPADGPEPTIITELVNRPAVVSPWELNEAYDSLLRDLAWSAPDSVDALRDAFEPVRRAWRNAWARFGDSAEGLATYAVLQREAAAAIRPAADGVRLPNGTLFLEAVHNHVLVVTEPGASAPPRRTAGAGTPCTRTPTAADAARPVASSARCSSSARLVREARCCSRRSRGRPTSTRSAVRATR